MSRSLFDADSISQSRLAILASIARARYPIGSTEIRKRLDLMGWRRDKNSHMGLIQKLLTDGLIAGSDGEVRTFTLTEKGWDKLKGWIESAEGIVMLFGDILHITPPRLVAPTHVHKEAMVQRLPTPEELDQIISRLHILAARVITSHKISGVSPSYLIELRIEEIDWDKRIGKLPERTREQRKIRKRQISITPELEPILREAIGNRKTGFVFLTRGNNPWVRDRISRAYRVARAAAGISEEVLIMGRGGTLPTGGEAGDDAGF